MKTALTTLIEQINATIDAARDTDGADRVSKCIEAGALLNHAAELVPYDDWADWVEDNIDATPSMVETLVRWAREPGGVHLWDAAVALYIMAVDDGYNSPNWPARDEYARMANGTWLLYNCNGLLAMVTNTGKVFDRPGGNRLDLQ